MSDRSDIILLLGAMVVFSYLLLNINGFLLRNNRVQTQTEIQYSGISLAEDIIDNARWLSFDAIDQYANYNKSDTTKYAIYNVSATLYFVTLDSTNTPAATTTNHKRLDVTVKSSGLSNPITLSYIKNK